MVQPKQKDENAKDPRWKVPVELPGVKPQQYREEGAFAPKPRGKRA